MTTTTTDTERRPTADADAVLLEAEDLTKVHAGVGRSGEFTAVDAVSMQLSAGRIRALVGESGSGKTTLARMLTLGDTATAGTIRFRGKAVTARNHRDRRAHPRHVQLIMQDPFASLNRLHPVSYILGRPLLNLAGCRRRDLRRRTIELLELVNLTPGERYLDMYPYQLSGGQRQRVAIARALAAGAAVLIGDEPVSMLDVSIRLEILELFADLCAREQLAMLYVTHDIASARYFADEIDVIYASRLVEGGPAELVTQHPRHPYTQLLLDSAPDPDRVRDPEEDRASYEDLQMTGRQEQLRGCPFADRCPFVMDICRQTPPPRVDFADGQWTRCWLAVDETA